MTAIEINKLNYKVRGFALQDITMNVPKGMITGLVGCNGAGKTTLISLIADGRGFESGSILYDGEKYWENERGIKRKLGIMYDDTYYNTTFKPAAFKKRIAKYLEGFDFAYFDRYMEHFGLPMDKPLSKYSKGMEQKFKLIMTMARKPEILILDEPTSGVDPADRYQMMDMLQEYMEEEENTVLFSTHITSDLDKIADYLIFIDGGRIVLTGEKEILLDRYRKVEIPLSKWEESMKAKMIGLSKTSFGYSGITDSEEIWQQEGIQTERPVVEDLAVNIREIHRKLG